MTVTAGPPALDQGSPPPAHRRHRRWPWITVGVVFVAVAALAAVFLFTGSSAKQVSLNQARSRLPAGQGAGPLGSRPSPGVYEYQGSGTDRLTLPPKTQPQGPSMPVTVTLRGADCWTFRVDFSTHHWQSWDFCRRGTDVRETGGQVWQLWPLGPMSLTNSTTVVCSPEALILPAQPVSDQTWTAHCSATSSAVKGKMEASAVYRYLGRTTVTVDGAAVPAEHISITQTDQGSQTGTERYEMWIQPQSGLILRLDQDLQVDTPTPLGPSTYTQKGTLSLASASVHQG